MKVPVRIRRTVLGCAEVILLGGVAAFARAEEDIRDIRGPKTVPAGSWAVYAVVMGVVVVTLCAAYVIWRRSHHGPSRTRSLTLSEQTLQSLESTRSLMRPDTAREFGIAASEVIRNYIEKRFEVVATQRTTEEFLQSLLESSRSEAGSGLGSKSNDTLARHRSLLAEFLQQCDFVKFAGASLAIADMEALFQSARGFVLETAGA